MTDLPEPVAPAKRKSLSPKIRFEVFKRDKFTCQYCGESAPSVVLQCDHIHPVADGGANDILNLVTACAACNSGKGARLLSDDVEIGKQIAQMAELEERRQQLEMLMQWRNSLRGADEDVLDSVCTAFSVGGYKVSEQGRATVRRWLKTFSPSEILHAAQESFDSYGEWLDADRLTIESWQAAFSKTHAVARVIRDQKDRPYLPRLFYIRAIVRNKTNCVLDVEFIEAAIKAGADPEKIVSLARRCDYITHFTREIERFLDEHGRPWTEGRPWS